MSKVIDVRTPVEFSGGHVAGSLNIPLTQIPSRIEELRSYGEHLIICCASGNRSGQAVNYLRQFGIDCENGGAWTSVNFQISQLS